MEHPVIFFDGVCNLCNGTVRFIIKHDRKGLFRFAALQSDTARAMLPQMQINSENPGTILLLMDGNVYQRSTAALKIAKLLDGLCPVLYGLMIIPVFIRDFFYNQVARNRYKIWGRQESCWMPTPELKERFL